VATDEEARAARDAKLDALHERLTGAVEQLVSGDDWRRALEFAARFRARSFGNTLLIWVQHLEAFEQGRVPEPEPSYVAGYKQWQALGRQVEKGQPGYMIFAPVTGRFASSNPADPESWRRLDRFEKPKPGEVRALSHGRREAGLCVGCLADERRSGAGATTPDAAGRRRPGEVVGRPGGAGGGRGLRGAAGRARGHDPRPSRRSFSAGGALAVSAMAGEALRISDTVVASCKGSVSHG
jgi:hypothetical protein